MSSSYDQNINFLDLLLPAKQIETDLDNGVVRAQQEHAVSKLFLMSVASFWASIAVIILSMLYVPLWRVLLWGSFGLFTAALQYVSWRRFKGRKAPDRVSGKFLRKIELSAIFYGIVWGVITILLRRENDLISYVYLFTIQAGMVAGLTSLLSPLPRVALRFAAASLMPSIVIGFATGSVEMILLSCLSIVLIGSLIAGSINSYSQLRDTISSLLEARDARRDLTDAIESLNDAFSIHSSSGELVLANERYRSWFAHGDDASEAMADEPYRINDGRWVLCTGRPTSNGGRVTIHTDVSALKNRERELIAARSEAEKADDAKSRFLSTMSHELLMPLNIVLGFSKLMMQDSNIRLSDAEVAEYADNIYRSGDHLLRLTRDIIDYSKIGLDKYLLDREAVDIAVLLTECIHLTEMHYEIADKSNIDVKIGPEIGDLLLDRFAMKRAITSLLGNAVKFAGTEGRIIVRVGLTAKSQPYVSIRDFGPGIPESQLGKVFEAFHQLQREPSQSKGGTGLGLTLCRHLTRLHGGDVHLKSHGENGLSAIILLPADAHRQKPVSRPVQPRAIA